MMVKSLAAQIVSAPKDFSDARAISDELGYMTVNVGTVGAAAKVLEGAVPGSSA
jgi:hypothetical protein